MSLKIKGVDLDKASKEELLSILQDIYESPRGKAYLAYRYQVDKMTEFLQDEPLVDQGLEDKESKMFDRGKVIMDKFDEYVKKAEGMYESIVENNINLDKYKEGKKSGSVKKDPRSAHNM
jgi:hypothetical protein